MGIIKVLHFELSENVGGIESFLRNVYTIIDRDKFKFDFVTTSDTPALGRDLEKLGGTIYKVPPYQKVFAYKKAIAAILENNEYDVIHIHKNSAANIIPLKMANKLKRRPLIIVHSHNTSPSVGKITHFLHYLNKNKLYHLADCHFACSKLAANWMYGTQQQVFIVPNGVIASRFIYNEDLRRKKRMELKIPNECLVVGHVGRFTEQKNHSFLLDIFNEMIKIKPNCKLLLIGTGALEKKIADKVRMLGLENNVIFCGLRTDIPELMIAMDLFILPSLYEGLPIVAVEAQAAGLPIYMADTVSKETDLLQYVSWFSLKDKAKSIAEKIICDSKSFSSTDRVERNKQLVQAGYDIESTVRKLEKIYSSCK